MTSADMKENTTSSGEDPAAWTTDQIRKAIKDAGLSQRAIAERCGMTPQAIGQTVQGVTQGRLARRAIAECLGLQATDIWPDADLPLRERRLRTAS